MTRIRNKNNELCTRLEGGTDVSLLADIWIVKQLFNEQGQTFVT